MSAVFVLCFSTLLMGKQVMANGVGVIAVGRFQYLPPFDDTVYPKEIADVLRRRRSEWDLVDEILWYIDLGVAHLEVADNYDEEYRSEGDENENETVQQELEKAIASFQQSTSLCHEVIEENAESDAEFLLAASYSHLAEAYSRKGPTTTDSSRQYNQQSHDLYKKLLEQKDSALSPEQLMSAELGWATSLHRMAMGLIQPVAPLEEKQSSTTSQAEIDNESLQEILQNNPDLVDQMAGGDMEMMKQVLSMVMEYDISSFSKEQENTKKAQTMFLDATEVFERAVKLETETKERRRIMLLLAKSKHNLSTTYLMQDDIGLAAKLSEEAYGLYEETLPHFETEGNLADIAETQRGLCECLYSLATIYLQMNSFELSKDRYRQASKYLNILVGLSLLTCALLLVHLFTTYNVIPDQLATNLKATVVGSDVDAQIAEYENLLQEYHESFSVDDVGQYDREGYFDDENGYLMKDDAYEADIHVFLGMLYLTRGDDPVLAIVHFEQATKLYEVSGEGQSANMASAKISLASLFLQTKEFDKSAFVYAEAVDIYRSTGLNSFVGDSIGGLATLIEQVQQASQPEGSEQTEKPATDTATSVEIDDKTGIVLDLAGYLSQNATTLSA